MRYTLSSVISVFFLKKKLPAVCSISQIFQTISNRQHLSGTANLNLNRMMVRFSRILFNKSSKKKDKDFSNLECSSY